MEKTWRWFGRKDNITLDMLRQIGVEGIVTSLYEAPNGSVWPYETIQELADYIKSFGLRWSVVESLPVSESIKYGGADRDQLISNYQQSLRHLAQAGIKTVCYNFMPVIDWIRTELNYQLADGTYTLYFDKIRFAYFDCFILKRPGASADYTEEELQQVYALDKTITQQEKDDLVYTIIIKTQGFVSGNFSADTPDPVSLFNKLLSLYSGIDKAGLRANMQYFLERVVPVAEECGINLCVHPDDPPFPVLGLPRIVTGGEDIEWILRAVDNPHNGLTFCTGSLSTGLHNDVPALAKRFASRTHFVHLRSTAVEPNGNFIEASHLEGRGQLLEVIRIFEKENPGLPMRVDHGKLMLDDVQKAHNPGYSFLGRMFALGQVSGLIAAAQNERQQQTKKTTSPQHELPV
ncbi:mannonate dehydratase [Paraflavisolibacter sp. H34]|uniref:mannonate dehydratase n=1 Tax=Huijunlia imazamoxiresistens TaxID=3127457 RepID=UPI003017EF97